MGEMKRLPAIVVAALSVASFAFVPLGCNGGEETSAGGRTRLRLMTMQLRPTFDEYMTALLASFEALHPDTRVEWMDFPAEGYLNKLQALFLGGDPPEVVNLSFDLGPPLARRGQLVDLRPLLPEQVFDAYFPRILRTACTLGEETFALPWYLSSAVLFYNRSILDEAGIDHPPATRAEMFEMCRVIRERCPGKYGFLDSLSEAGQLRDLLITEGVPLVERGETGRLRAAFATPAGAAALRIWSDAFKQGILPREVLARDHRRAIEYYKAGRTAFFTTGAQFLGQIREDAPDIYAVTDVAPLPRPPTGQHSVDVMTLAVPERGDSPEANARERRAALLAAFVTDGPNQLAFCRRVTILPSAVEAARDPFFSESDGSVESRARVIAARQLESAEMYIPALPEAGRLWAALNTAVEKACLGEATPEESLAEAAATWNAIFDTIAPESSHNAVAGPTPVEQEAQEN